MNRYAKEPLFYFLLIGLGIFVIDHFFNRADASIDEIIITDDDVSRLSQFYKKNWNEDPSPETIEKLIAEYVDSEIYYKEALKLNLDHNDEIIKRRLRQKYEFVAQDLADTQDPSEEDLQAFYKEHIEDYRSEPQITFYQYYINSDLHKDDVGVAQKLYQKLRSKQPSEIEKSGDAFHIVTFQDSKELSEVTRVFGSEFAASLFSTTKTGWQEPMRSGFGMHVVHVTERISSKEVPLEEIIDEVKIDWKTSNRQYFSDALTDAIRKNYKIIRQDGE